MQTRLFIIGLIAISSLWACEPERDPFKLYDELVVSTGYDEGTDFTGYVTYSIGTDTIGFVSNRNQYDTILYHPESEYPRPVLQRIESNLSQLGYIRVNKDQDPDWRINVYVVNDFNLFQQVYYPGYSYPSYYGYGYGYGSYYGYPIVNTYASNTGSLVIEILDLRNVTPDNKVKVIWSAYAGDVYTTVDLIKQTEKAIDQAFVQSPYLNRQ